MLRSETGLLRHVGGALPAGEPGRWACRAAARCAAAAGSRKEAQARVHPASVLLHPRGAATRPRCAACDASQAHAPHVELHLPPKP